MATLSDILREAIEQVLDDHYSSRFESAGLDSEEAITIVLEILEDQIDEFSDLLKETIADMVAADVMDEEDDDE